MTKREICLKIVKDTGCGKLRNSGILCTECGLGCRMGSLLAAKAWLIDNRIEIEPCTSIEDAVKQAIKFAPCYFEFNSVVIDVSVDSTDESIVDFYYKAMNKPKSSSYPNWSDLPWVLGSNENDNVWHKCKVLFETTIRKNLACLSENGTAIVLYSQIKELTQQMQIPLDKVEAVKELIK